MKDKKNNKKNKNQKTIKKKVRTKIVKKQHPKKHQLKRHQLRSLLLLRSLPVKLTVKLNKYQNPPKMGHRIIKRTIKRKTFFLGNFID
jgi:hypothetical protein